MISHTFRAVKLSYSMELKISVTSFKSNINQMNNTKRKNMRTTQFLVMALSALVFAFAGCSKDNDDNGIPDNSLTAEQLKAEILGKWTFTSGISLQSGLAKQSTKKPRFAGLRNNIAEAPRQGATSGFIEFLADGTFFILDAQGNFFAGDYTTKAGQVIDLSDFGSIKEIRIKDGGLDCTITYTRLGQNHTLEIHADKAADIPAGERTTLLCRTWEVERIIAGWDEQELAQEGVTRITATFSPSGTYVFRFFRANGDLVLAEAEYWKWHPTDTNRFVYWTTEDVGQIDNDENAVRILKLTQSQLEVASYDGDDVNTHLVFKASNN